MSNAHFVHCTACCSIRSLHCVLLDSLTALRAAHSALEPSGTAAGSGTRAALMELREAPYPYSKMCELCELCELFVKMLLSKTECAILPDGALLIVMKKVTIISV